MCKRMADFPEDIESGGFAWGGIGTSKGLLEASYFIDGDGDSEQLDLCYECAEWLISQIKSRVIKRT